MEDQSQYVWPFMINTDSLPAVFKWHFSINTCGGIPHYSSTKTFPSVILPWVIDKNESSHVTSGIRKWNPLSIQSLWGKQCNRSGKCLNIWSFKLLLWPHCNIKYTVWINNTKSSLSLGFRIADFRTIGWISNTVKVFSWLFRNKKFNCTRKK